jgi:anti-sigma regulatory factor (Ser/Thr protein kinase)
VSLADQAPPPDQEFTHSALIVDSDEALREWLVPAIRRALDAGENVLMVVHPDTERVVRASLGDQAADLEWSDTRPFYQRLGFTFQTFRRYLEQQHAAGQRVYIVAEPDIPSSGSETATDRVAAYLPYEAVCGQAFARYGCPITCIWDSRRHPTLVIEGVRSLHDHELSAAGPVPNPGFIRPSDYLAGRNGIAFESPPPDTDLDLSLRDEHDLAPLRAELRVWAASAGFDPLATADVLVATTEVATNGLIHGAPPVRIRCWRYADTLITQVDDAGGIPIPPMAGYQPPDDRRAGRGMWLARQLADSVTTYTSTSDSCTAVRLHFPRDVTHLPRSVD